MKKSARKWSYCSKVQVEVKKSVEYGGGFNECRELGGMFGSVSSTEDFSEVRGILRVMN